MSGQLQFDWAPQTKALAGQLLDRRQMPSSGNDTAGAARLVRKLVRRGLQEAALPAAAGLVLALDREARAEARASAGTAKLK